MLHLSKFFSTASARSELFFFICRFILHAKKTAFVVEHDFIMATYLADRVIVFEGIPSLDTVANSYVIATFILSFNGLVIQYCLS